MNEFWRAIARIMVGILVLGLIAAALGLAIGSIGGQPDVPKLESSDGMQPAH